MAKDSKEQPTAAKSLNEYDFPLVQCDSEGEIFCITPESRIYADGVDITQDDTAIAKCFKRWVKIWGNCEL